MNIFDRLPPALFSPLTGKNNRRAWVLIERLYDTFFAPDRIPTYAEGYLPSEITKDIERFLLDANWDSDDADAALTPLGVQANQIYRRLVDTGWFAEERNGHVDYVNMRPMIARFIETMMQLVNDGPQLLGGSILMVHNQIKSVPQDPRGQASGFIAAAKSCGQLINSMSSMTMRVRDLMEELSKENATPVFIILGSRVQVPLSPPIKTPLSRDWGVFFCAFLVFMRQLCCVNDYRTYYKLLKVYPTESIYLIYHYSQLLCINQIKKINMKLYQTLEQQLKLEPNFVTDNGELKKWVVLNKAQNFDEELIGLLLDHAELKAKFFVTVKDTLVFNQNLFVQFLEQKNYLNNSYTQYKNKVGLMIDGKYLKQRNEVALVWPFKDCVLEGGQSREEDKREEIFFNEILAQDEITQLLEPKVLTNAKRIDKDGEKPLDQFNRNEEGIITDNLIIKGNNLLALHTIKKEFAGKVKLIYIDPPYNTGGDSFKYNDNFNHSTWLTFMKNRFQVALELLSEDGAIYVHIDHHQLGYLNVLMDEVFGEENKVQVIAIKTASPAGFKTVNPGPIDVTEYILFYTKNKSKFKFRKGYVPVGYNTNYNIYVEKHDDVNLWQFTPLKEKVISNAGFANEAEAKRKYGNLWSSLIKLMIEDFAYKNASNVVSVRDPHKPTEKLKVLMEQSKLEEKIIEYEREDGSIMYLYKGGALAFYSNKMQELDGKLEVTELLTDFWNHISWAGIAKEGGVKLKNGKKPEKLIKQIIELATDENDIVLDYHLGSGTTTAVAHKLKRQYIGLEQLDYGNNDSLIRMDNVIKGDATGISKAVNWAGGGDFVYLELKKYNQAFIEQIEAAQDSEALLQIWEQMKAKSFLNYNVDIKKQDAHIEEFRALSLELQKQHLCELLDKNQLYVNLSSLNDADFACTEVEKAVTQDFYQIKK